MKRQNVCKRHVVVYTGFKQTKRTIFLHVILFNQVSQVQYYVTFITFGYKKSLGSSYCGA